MFGFAAAAATTTAPSPAVTHHTYEDTASAVAGEQSSPAQSYVTPQASASIFYRAKKIGYRV